MSEGFQRLISSRSASTYQVLIGLASSLEEDGAMRAPQSAIAKALGMNPTLVSRAIRDLLKREVILLRGKGGRHNVYELHPDFLWLRNMFVGGDISIDDGEVVTHYKLQPIAKLDLA